MNSIDTNYPVISVVVNGARHVGEVDPRTSLLDFVRTHLGLTGTKRGCNQGACGACTVLLDDERILSCLTLAVQCSGRDLVTIEGIGSSTDLHPLQQAFIDHDGFQCGYCTPGQICSAIAMVREMRRGVPSAIGSHSPSDRSKLDPTEVRERMSGNLCRCGAYNGIVAAICATGASEHPS